MKNKITSFKFKAIYFVFSFLLTIPLFSQVPEFDNDKPTTTDVSQYTQDFSQPWDGTKFYNQWDAVTTNVFGEADVTNGYLQFVWSAKRILVSKKVNSIPYTVQVDLDYGTGSNRAGVVLRTNPMGTPGTTEFDLSADFIQQPTIADPAFNSVGIAFYPTADGTSMTVQFSSELNGASTTRTLILVPKPEAVTSLLGRGTLRIEDFGTSIYVYYNNVPFTRVNLANMIDNVYTSGEVFNANMESVGTFTDMQVESMGKVAIAQRDAKLQLFSATLTQQEMKIVVPPVAYNFDDDMAGMEPAFVSSANGTFTTNTDETRGNTLQVLTAATGNTAIVNLDAFPALADYSVTWKENYGTATRAGMLLRGGVETNTSNEGLKVGYLFQSSVAAGQMRIFLVGPTSYTGIANVPVAAPGAGLDRWYRATVNGSDLKFEYSDDGKTFMVACTGTDATYTSGLTQFAEGYGQPIGDLFVDNISYRKAPVMIQNSTYDFETDTAGIEPDYVSSANGTFTTNYDAARGNTLQILTATSGNTAIVNLDAFASATDYSITWKENYGTATRAGMLLRGGAGTNSSNEGLKEGYLFQSSVTAGQMRIFLVSPTAYTGIANVPVPAPGVGVDRWYRATVDGSDLKFEYSDDGKTFMVACTGTDATYTSGLTQFAEGYGQPIGDLFVDNIVFRKAPIMIQNSTYDFETDTAGMEPDYVSSANGTFTTNYDATRGNTLQILTATSGNTAIVNLDAFASAADYSITWKENYGTATRAGMLLRGGAETNTSNEGLKEGYLFQSSVTAGQMRIFLVSPTAYTSIANVPVAAPGAGVDRWYRATVEGSNLTFEYSDDGTTFMVACTGTDETYTSGLTQFAEGYGQPIGDLFVDDIVFKEVEALAVAKNVKMNFAMYPNPARETVNLSFDNNNGEISAVTIYDIQGKVVKKVENKFTNNASINVSSLRQGIYFLKIKSAAAEKTKKLIIN